MRSWSSGAIALEPPARRSVGVVEFFAQSYRQNGIAQYSNPNWRDEQIRLDPDKDDIW